MPNLRLINQPKLYHLEQNIWNKMEKFNRNGQEKKCLLYIFAYFLIANAKVKGDWH